MKHIVFRLKRKCVAKGTIINIILKLHETVKTKIRKNTFLSAKFIKTAIRVNSRDSWAVFIRMIKIKNRKTLASHIKRNYIVIMKAKIIKIGNSLGIRIPKPLLQESGIGPDVDISTRDGAIIIRSAPKTRDNWGAAFKEMAKRGDDAPLDITRQSGMSDWDDTEWEW